MATEDMNALEEEYTTPPRSDQPMSNNEWEHFADGDLVCFLVRYNLQKVTVDDGYGHKATAKLNKDGDTKVSITCNLS